MHRLLKLQWLCIISATSIITIMTPGPMASELNTKLNERIREFLLKTVFSILRKHWQCKMHLLCICSYLKTVFPLKVESLLGIITERGANHLFTKKFFCITSTFTGDFSSMHLTWLHKSWTVSEHDGKQIFIKQFKYCAFASAIKFSDSSHSHDKCKTVWKGQSFPLSLGMVCVCLRESKGLQKNPIFSSAVGLPIIFKW